MNKVIPVLLASLAFAGCMTSYPLWDPEQPPAEAPAARESVTIEGRVAEIDRDERSIEIESSAEGADSWIHVEFNDDTVVYSSARRDESARGLDGLDLLEEDDTVTVSGLKADVDEILAREVSLVGNEVPATTRPVPGQTFQPRDRVPGIVRSIDTEAGRIVLETVEHGMIAVYCDGDTPVFFRGGIFHIANLELGDGVTVTIGATDEGDPAAPWVTAIDVTRSVSHDGPPSAARGPIMPVPPPSNLLLDVIEIVGMVKRVEAQGFEIEAEGGQLRYVTADGEMFAECGSPDRVRGLKVGMVINVRALEVGDRVIAQWINCLGRSGDA